MHYLGQLSDLPLPHSSGPRLRTRRKPLAQILLCQGCCCGQEARGLPSVPLTWLKPLWKAEKLNKIIQLTVSGCLGPCDLPNVCSIITPMDQAWYGRLSSQEDYAVLLDWARRCRDQGQLQPLPHELAHLRFERWPGAEGLEPFIPIVQDPADIILLTAADTEVLTWSAAVAGLPKNFPSVRALNLDRLRDRKVMDAYLDDVLQDSRVLVVRLLGGLGYWREQMEQIHLLAIAHNLGLVCLPGDAQPDPDLAALCTVPLKVADTIWRYSIEGGIANAAKMLGFIATTLLNSRESFDPPETVPEIGLYHPDHPGVLDYQIWQEHFCKPNRLTAGIIFYRSHWVTGNLAPIDSLVRALEEREFNVLAAFGPDLGAIVTARIFGKSLDVLITTTSFSINKGPESGPICQNPYFLGLDNCPILQAIFCSSSENVWAANIAGLAPRDIAMNVALPEFDGRIITTAVSFKNTLTHDPNLQTEIIRYQPRPDRINYVANLANNWARLRHLKNDHKKIAILLGNYPSKNARVGNAVGLDTPASLHALLLALHRAGYKTGPSLPESGQVLIETLIAASVQDQEFATVTAYLKSPGWVSRDQYTRWLETCSPSAKKRIHDRWGGPDNSPQYHNQGFPIPGLFFGNIFVGIQPARGYDQDPSAVYHSPDLSPPPFYLAFYRWIRDIFGAHALIHLGKHGNLEWLPGKGSALSASCFPEVVLPDIPVIYPYIINNPGEGTQAKRRSAAVIVDHLIPPMTQADTYGELRQLENLLDEYYAVQTLDPTKGPLILETIGELVEQAQLYRDLECDPAVLKANELGSPVWLNQLDGYLCEIKEAQIRDGLHILGCLPEGDQLNNLLQALVRVDNGRIPGLVKALAQDLGFDLAILTKDLGAPAPSCYPNGKRPIGRETLFLSPCRTCGDFTENLSSLARFLIHECWRTQSPEMALETLLSQGFTTLENTRSCLDFLWNIIWPRLQLCHQEIDHVLLALNGSFVPPGPSGAPTRGKADVLPTGRNFFSIDVRAIPSPTAWRIGCAAATSLLERHKERTGGYPESLAMVVWGTSNMRTQGDDIAEILYLLGVRPCWDEGNRRVVGLEVIPLVDLGRSRIDVTVRISGLFRDAFPNLVRLLNEAVTLVANLEEPLDRNHVRAHIARDTAWLSRESKNLENKSLVETEGDLKTVTQNSVSVEKAARLAGLRVFGSKPGAYGAGLLALIDGGNWQTSQDLAEVYLTWSSFAYTGAAELDGLEEREAFRLRLANTELVVQNQDNREHDIFDSDDYFQFHGGMVAAVRAIKGTAPAAYIGDTSKPEDVRARTLREEAYRVFRSRVVNPRWLAGVMRHGYKGAVEMAATVDYLFGYDATAEILDDWMYERLAAAYLFDEAVRDFLRQTNPWAERAMIERLLEAAEKELWEQPDPAILSRLLQQHSSNDACLEGKG